MFRCIIRYFKLVYFIYIFYTAYRAQCYLLLGLLLRYEGLFVKYVHTLTILLRHDDR